MPEAEPRRNGRRYVTAKQAARLRPMSKAQPLRRRDQGELPVIPDERKVHYWMPVVHRTYVGGDLRARDMARRALVDEAVLFHQEVWHWSDGTKWAWPDMPFTVRESPLTPEDHAAGLRRLIAFPKGLDPMMHYTFTMDGAIQGRRVVEKQQPAPMPPTEAPVQPAPVSPPEEAPVSEPLPESVPEGDPVA